MADSQSTNWRLAVSIDQIRQEHPEWSEAECRDEFNRRATEATLAAIKPRKLRGEPKPIRVFYSALSCRFYATRAYREVKPGVVEVTGDKFDVTNDIAGIIEQHGITFTPASGDIEDGYIRQNFGDG